MSTIIIFLSGLVIMLVMMIKTKIGPFMSMLFGALIIGIGCGVAPSDTISAITGGFGNTCKSIGLVIIFGTILGTYLEKSNSCQRIATTLLKLTGEDKAGVALAATGYFVSIPVFSDVALIMLSPIIKAVSKKTGRVVCVFAVLTASALLCTNAYVAPTPAPLAVAATLNLDIGKSIIYGLIVAAISIVVVYFYCMLFLDKKPADWFTEIEAADDKATEVKEVDEKDMPSLFDLYTRGAYDNDISVEGTGLGLSISKQIIELMNGTIDVDSKLGEGTTFTVKLPLQYVVRTQDDKNVTDNGKDNNIIKNDQSLSDIKVMVVDDNQYNREIACELLRENGAHIIECASGSEAVDYIKYNKGIVDIILMDVCMPDMDGFEATRLIRQLEKDRWQDIPIVAMTANAFDEDRKKALEHGMNGHIAKPFDIDTFAETVLEYVKY